MGPAGTVSFPQLKGNEPGIPALKWEKQVAPFPQKITHPVQMHSGTGGHLKYLQPRPLKQPEFPKEGACKIDPVCVHHSGMKELKKPNLGCCRSPSKTNKLR